MSGNEYLLLCLRHKEKAQYRKVGNRKFLVSNGKHAEQLKNRAKKCKKST